MCYPLRIFVLRWACYPQHIKVIHCATKTRKAAEKRHLLRKELTHFMDEKSVKATTNVPESAAGNVRAEVPAVFSEVEAVEAEQTELEAPEADNEAADATMAEPAATKAAKAKGKEKAKRSPRSRNMMYEQQLAHLPSHIKDLDGLFRLIEDVLEPDRFAVILHDKDLNEQGELARPHLHAFMTFKNPRSCASIAKQLGDKSQTVTVWDDRPNNGFCYLTHATDRAKAEGKYQYDPAEVRANFDYATLIQETTQQVKKAQTYGESAHTKAILDMVYAGILSKKEAESQLPGHVLGRIRRQLDDVHAKHLERAAAEWRQEMSALGKTVRVIWFYGPAGTGKTSAAKAVAAKSGQPYYISGSTRDIFQAYSGEHTIILDELRAGSIPYADLLRILDPYSIQSEVMAPSRYNDKALACDLFIITCPYDPHQFYNEMFSVDENKNKKRKEQTDSFEQLLRRITLTVCMTATEILLAEYDEEKKVFIPNTSSSRPNPYSATSRPAPVTDAAGMFDKMFP